MVSNISGGTIKTSCYQHSSRKNQGSVALGPPVMILVFESGLNDKTKCQSEGFSKLSVCPGVFSQSKGFQKEIIGVGFLGIERCFT